MKEIEKRFNTMLNYCYMVKFEKDAKKRKIILQKMSEYVNAQNSLEQMRITKQNSGTPAKVGK